MLSGQLGLTLEARDQIADVGVGVRVRVVLDDLHRLGPVRIIGTVHRERDAVAGERVRIVLAARRVDDRGPRESVGGLGGPAEDLDSELADGDFATAAAGWTGGELTVEVLKAAAESDEGLTRASIINAARAMDYAFSLARDGVSFTMNGAEDPYGLESLQVVQYDADTKTYTDIGDLVTTFEGQTELP